MSDMEQSDVVPVDPAPVADVTAAEPVAPEPPAEVPADVPDAFVPPAVEATPVVARQPSSASPTQQPESAPVVEKAPLSVADAARVVLIYVKARRVSGDGDLDAAVADLEDALAAQSEQA